MSAPRDSRSGGTRPRAAAVTAARLGVAALVLAGTAALSQVPYGRAADARLRLSWRARGQRVEECRRPSADELGRLPPHMRQTEICEGRVAPFLLRLMIDGSPAIADTVRAAGAREDRPLYVFREVRLDAGEHAIELTFESVAMAGETKAAAGAAAARPAFPSSLTYRTRTHLGAGEIALITYDEDSRSFVLRGPGAR